MKKMGFSSFFIICSVFGQWQPAKIQADVLKHFSSTVYKQGQNGQTNVMSEWLVQKRRRKEEKGWLHVKSRYTPTPIYLQKRLAELSVHLIDDHVLRRLSSSSSSSSNAQTATSVVSYMSENASRCR